MTELSVESRKQRGSWICLAYFIDMLSIDVCTIRHLRRSGRLVQDLNVRTVYRIDLSVDIY